MYKDDKMEEEKSNKDLSKLIHMPESTLSRVNHSLEKKGYLEDASALTKRFKLRGLDLLFVWKFKEQDEKIEDIKSENAELKRKISRLEEQVETLTKTIKPKINPIMIME